MVNKFGLNFRYIIKVITNVMGLKEYINPKTTQYAQVTCYQNKGMWSCTH